MSISIWRRLLFLFLIFTNVCVSLGQQFPEEDENDEKSLFDDLSPEAESLILSSLFGKIEDAEEDLDKEPGASQLVWITKRQHPGKRMVMDLEKRQHPGRRSLSDQILSIPSSQLAYLNELSKRQHPGKRYLPYNKRQHPGKRGWDDETESEETLEKRQHPGKRYLGSQTPDNNILCDPQESSECSKGSLLLELLDKISKVHSEEKRQHPGRNSLLDGEIEAEE
ncbi:thyrotropin releasing hormone [Pantherophis guttatus]|uniref:Pro-thyrotropin-releasing hormone n=1 Tax=Pantherophis guttatus TaxID=94885 RepID=A0A6P9D7E3_PANGU|nr:thyrotropin releasing hormone [Pantherophis guttatus]XP_034287475.1 thyrotropin releasing hormone [Pantherophis guttatus]